MGSFNGIAAGRCSRLRPSLGGSRSGLPNIHGAPYDPAIVLARFKQALAAAGLPDQCLHQLRHYAATFLVAKGVPKRVVMEILGHSKVASTANLYAHVLLAAHREMADLIDQSLRTKKQETAIR